MNKRKRDSVSRCERHILRCADILCKAAYRMCKRMFEDCGDDGIPDCKALKESCAAVKEAANLLAGINKDKPDEKAVRIMFEDSVREMAE